MTVSESELSGLTPFNNNVSEENDNEITANWRVSPAKQSCSPAQLARLLIGLLIAASLKYIKN
jgi:hypothetical protein